MLTFNCNEHVFFVHESAKSDIPNSNDNLDSYLSQIKVIITQLTLALFAYLIFVISNIVEVALYEDKSIDVSFLIMITRIRQCL